MSIPADLKYTKDHEWIRIEGGEAVIGLIVRGTNDQLGALTGRLGSLPGVRAKSALTSAKSTHPQQKRKE